MRQPGAIVRLSELRGRRVVVWGTGREGAAAVKAIAPFGLAELCAVQDKATASAHSVQWTPQVAALAPLRTADDGLAAILAADVVVRSPVIGETHPWVRQAREQGVRITGGTALWLPDHAERTIGVTGTKGKSTTSTLTHHLLTAVGRPCVLGGNIGIPTLDLPEAELYVVELSMYQCADLDDSPRVVALTSLYPEHLDWSGGEAEYYRHKLNVVAHGPQRVVVNALDDRLMAELAAFGPLPVLAVNRPDTFYIGAGPDGAAWVHYGDQPLFPRSALPLVGRHNESNLCVALGALASVGVDVISHQESLGAAAATFVPLDHRLTPIEDPSGLTFVDDSISTIPQSTVHAIEAYAHRPLTVILGGEDRGVDYGPLRDFLAERGVVATLIGVPDSGRRILDVLREVPTLTMAHADDLVAAVRLARELTPVGGVVLLSPAAPSYDHFDNFEHRSRVFRQAIDETAG